MKNTQVFFQIFSKYYSQINQVEERISEIEDQLNEIKLKDKIREKNNKMERTKPPENMGLCEKTKPTFNWFT